MKYNLPAPHTKAQGLWGQPLYFFETVSSTLDVASTLIKETSLARSGMVIIAEQQTQGRGQQQKTWLDKKGASLSLSVLFKESDMKHTQKPNVAVEIMFCAMSALCKTIDALAKNTISTQIKWPNDILINNKKTAGILVEHYQGWVVLGIGVNIAYHDISSVVSTQTHPPTFPFTALDRHHIYETPINFYKQLLPLLDSELYLSIDTPLSYINTRLWKRGTEVLFCLNHTTELQEQETPSSPEEVTILEILLDGGLLVQNEQQKSVKYSGQIREKT